MRGAERVVLPVRLDGKAGPAVLPRGREPVEIAHVAAQCGEGLQVHARGRSEDRAPRRRSRLGAEHLAVRGLQPLRRHARVVLAEVLFHLPAACVAHRVDVHDAGELLGMLRRVGADQRSGEAVPSQKRGSPNSSTTRARSPASAAMLYSPAASLCPCPRWSYAMARRDLRSRSSTGLQVSSSDPKPCTSTTDTPPSPPSETLNLPAPPCTNLTRSLAAMVRAFSAPPPDTQAARLTKNVSRERGRKRGAREDFGSSRSEAGGRLRKKNTISRAPVPSALP